MRAQPGPPLNDHRVEAPTCLSGSLLPSQPPFLWGAALPHPQEGGQDRVQPLGTPASSVRAWSRSRGRERGAKAGLSQHLAIQLFLGLRRPHPSFRRLPHVRDRGSLCCWPSKRPGGREQTPWRGLHLRTQCVIQNPPAQLLHHPRPCCLQSFPLIYFGNTQLPSLKKLENSAK